MSVPAIFRQLHREYLPKITASAVDAVAKRADALRFATIFLGPFE